MSQNESCWFHLICMKTQESNKLLQILLDSEELILLVKKGQINRRGEDEWHEKEALCLNSRTEAIITAAKICEQWGAAMEKEDEENF